MSLSQQSVNESIIVIPARRNSKGIPFKNRSIVNGQTLVEHSMAFARNIPHSSIILSTDDEYFLGDSLYKEVVDHRPDFLTGDNVIISDVLIELIERKHLFNSFIIVLEPTCLPRSSTDLEHIYNGDFVKSGKTSFTSFSQSPVFLEKIWQNSEGRMVHHPNVWKRRQEYPTQYCLTGHYYGFLAKDLRDYYPGLCDSNVFPVFIEYDYVDINIPVDLELASKILSND